MNPPVPPNLLPRSAILGCRVDRLPKPEALERIRTLASGDSPAQIVTANTLMLLDAERDSVLRAILEEAALVWPESSGLSWAGRWSGQPFPDVTPGIDLMVELCALAEREGRAVFFLGARPGVAEAAAARLRVRFPSLVIAGTQHGYFTAVEETDVIARIRSSGASYLFVAMTVPNQEKWIARHRVELGVSVVMGVGGSFDVLSGRLHRAPAWMRTLGLEWLFRVCQEPWRWRRIAQLPVFVWRLRRRSLNDRKASVKRLSACVGVLMLGWMKAEGATLSVGDPAPHFTAASSDGNQVELAALIGQAPIVLYFYPKDDTPGCTKQACGLRDDFAAFRQLKAMVFGISYDSVESHKAFVDKYALPFALLSDPDHAIAQRYGANGLLFAKRMTFVIDKAGKIAWINDSVSPSTHSRELQDTLSRLP